MIQMSIYNVPAQGTRRKPLSHSSASLSSSNKDLGNVLKKTLERAHKKQGGLRIKKKYPGSFFFFKPLGLDLPTYVIRHIAIYSNVTSSS
jgi:hypothetical protein